MKLARHYSVKSNVIDYHNSVISLQRKEGSERPDHGAAGTIVRKQRAALLSARTVLCASVNL